MEFQDRLSFREIEPEDAAFCLELFLASREREFAPLPEDIRSQLAMHQYEIYRAGLRSSYPNAEQCMVSISSDGTANQPAGFIFIADFADHLRIIDLAVHPRFRNRGIGSLVLQTLMQRCGRSGKIMRGAVTPYNPARRLYARLGISELSSEHGYIQLEWVPHQTERDGAAPFFAGNNAADADTVSRDDFRSQQENP